MISNAETNKRRLSKLLRADKHCTRIKPLDFLQNKIITGCWEYQPSDQQGWHNNFGSDSARCYLVWSETGNSGMRFVLNGKVETFYDIPGWQYRIFNIPQPHCVFSNCLRRSYGFKVERVDKQIFNPIELENAEAILQVT